MLGMYHFPVGFLCKKLLLYNLTLSAPFRKIRMQSCNVNNVDYYCVGLVQSSLNFCHIHKIDCKVYDTESLFLKLVDKIF